MKRALTLIVFMLFGYLSFGQESMIYIPFKAGKKWSLADENGKVLFKPKFEETYPSTKNRIRCKKNDKYGFINPNGQVVIKPIYEKASDFNYFGGQTISHVTTIDSSFCIDLDGNPIIPITGCGGVISNRPNGLFVFNENGKFGVIGLGRDTVVQPTFKYIKNYDDGAFVFVQEFNQKYGVLNYKGDTIYGFSLDSIIYDITFSRATIYKIYKKGKVGVIGRNGIVEAEPKYDEIKPYYMAGLLCFVAFKKGRVIGYIYNRKEYWNKKPGHTRVDGSAHRKGHSAHFDKLSDHL